MQIFQESVPIPLVIILRAHLPLFLARGGGGEHGQKAFGEKPLVHLGDHFGDNVAQGGMAS